MLATDRASWQNPRILALLLSVFLCGAVVGAIAMRSNHEKLHRNTSSYWKDDKTQFFSYDKLKKDLNLTPDQSERLRRLGGAPPAERPDEAAYDELLGRVCAAVKPNGVIEERHVRDVVDEVWEAMQLRRLKAHLMGAVAHEGLEDLLRLLPYGAAALDLADRWVAREPRALEEVDARLAAMGLTLDRFSNQQATESLSVGGPIDRWTVTLLPRQGEFVVVFQTTNVDVAVRRRQRPVLGGICCELMNNECQACHGFAVNRNVTPGHYDAPFVQLRCVLKGCSNGLDQRVQCRRMLRGIGKIGRCRDGKCVRPSQRCLPISNRPRPFLRRACRACAQIHDADGQAEQVLDSMIHFSQDELLLLRPATLRDVAGNLRRSDDLAVRIPDG